MGLIKHDLSGPGYVILNVIRAMNIISLLMVVIASFVMLVKTFIVSQFFFFDGVGHVVTAFLSSKRPGSQLPTFPPRGRRANARAPVFLIVSELPIFRHYFATNWPLLSMNHGFVTLGLLMVIVGVSILGNLNKTATSQSALGMSFWQIVIASGILTMIMGFANIVAVGQWLGSFPRKRRFANAVPNRATCSAHVPLASPLAWCGPTVLLRRKRYMKRYVRFLRPHLHDPHPYDPLRGPSI
jgi:hypothetical protein